MAIDSLLQDLRYGWRTLGRNWYLTGASVATLAIGVGLNAAVFGVIDALMLRPPHSVRDADRLVYVRPVANYVQYVELATRTRTLELAVYSRSTVAVGVGPEAAAARIECVSQGYFGVLGVAPFLGRVFESGLDTPVGRLDVVVGHGFWQRALGSDPNIIGKTLSIAGRGFEVSGVAPPHFRGVEVEAIDAWLPITAVPEACSFSGKNLLDAANASWLRTVGRIRNEYSLAETNGEIEALISPTVPVPSTRREAQVLPVYGSGRPGLSLQHRVALWLLAGAGAVFLIGCVNVAGLQLIRGLDRRYETAVRIQLGATRRRLLTQLGGENALLCLGSAGAGFLVYLWTRTLLGGFFPNVESDAVDIRVFAVMAVCVIVSSISSAVVPVWQSLRVQNAGVLGDAGHAGLTKSAAHQMLPVIELAVALALVTAAGLFVRSLQNVTRDPGYDVDRVVIATMDLRHGTDLSDEDVRSTFDQWLGRVATLDSVQAASLSYGPLLNSGPASRVVPVRPFVSETVAMPVFNAVSENYFATLGTRILEGRAFGASDDLAAEPVVVLDQGLARALHIDDNPIGQCVVLGRIGCAVVVGISEQRRHGTLLRPVDELFVPLRQGALHGSEIVPRTLLVRLAADSGEAVRSVVSVVSTVHGASASVPAPLITVRRLTELADVQTRSWRMGVTAFGLFGTLTALLAAVGTYGVMAIMVRRRTREIGVRMALGATPIDVMRIIAGRGAVVVGGGLCLGVAMSIGVSRLIESVLFDVAPTDFSVMATASLLIGAAGFGGCVLPVLRATRVDPVATLRHI